jgi:hypothetical protein
MLNLIASGLENISGLLPEKWAGPMREAAASLRADAEAAGQIFENNLAVNADGVARAFSQAREKTELSKYDFMDAEGSSQKVNEYLDIAAESGAVIRSKMQESLDHARDITAEAKEWDKATSSMADSFSGATGSFRDFAAGNSESSGLAALSGLKIGSSDIGPVASASDRKAASRVSRSSRESMGSGRATDPMQSLLHKNDYNYSTTGGRMTDDQIAIRMDTRANESVQKDLSHYTGGMENASKAQAIDDLFRKYQYDIGGNPADLRKKAEADFEELVQKKKGGEDPKTVPGYDNKGHAPEKQQDPMTGIATTIQEIYNYMKQSLPQHALSA